MKRKECGAHTESTRNSPAPHSVLRALIKSAKAAAGGPNGWRGTALKRRQRVRFARVTQKQRALAKPATNDAFGAR